MESINPFVHIAHIAVKDRNYTASISICLTTHSVHVFKYNEHRCDYEVFATSYEAEMYLDLNL